MKAFSEAIVFPGISNKTIIKMEKNRIIPVSRIENEHRHEFPVIRIDKKGKILYANKASFPLLGEWNCFANNYLPEALKRQYPDLLNPDADFNLRMIANTSLYYLDVIGFRESGYIGIYGFLKEMNTCENKTSGLLVA